MFNVGVTLAGGAVTQLPARGRPGHSDPAHSDPACAPPSPSRGSRPRLFLRDIYSLFRGLRVNQNVKTPLVVAAGDGELCSPRRGERPVTVWDQETQPAPRDEALGRAPDFHPEGGGHRLPGRETGSMKPLSPIARGASLCRAQRQEQRRQQAPRPLCAAGAHGPAA